MKSLFSRFVRDCSGATAIEYGLITALITAALIGGATVLGDSINGLMDSTSNHLKDSQ
ncbi:Flp family type IVb pilin [Hoeflea sp. AS60]|uniref:Flp family type IVb pilin n=1 Tax=Hoeflea sp. AS60 TaxID=3135780 RepID=UPI00316CF583